jgi:hypothetical protein
MKVMFIFFLIVHTLIHLIGVSRSFHTHGMSAAFFMSDALLWLLSFVLFTMVILLYLLNTPAWEVFLVSGIVFSQVLILTNWKEAKYGTVINILLLSALLSGIIP